MAVTLPPPPTQASSGEFAWLDWYNQLYSQLSITGAIAWVLVDKAGSSIQDLQDHDHASLTNINGSIQGYHLSSAEYITVNTYFNGTGVPPLSARNTFFTAAANPTTSDIAAGTWRLQKNTTSGVLSVWANDGGVMKSVALT